MNKKLLVCGVFAVLTFSGTAMAECPSSLTSDQMYDCIVVEGAGDTYEIPADSKAVASTEKEQSDTAVNQKLAAVKQ